MVFNPRDMQKYILIYVTLLCTYFSSAQEISGEITYEVNYNIEIMKERLKEAEKNGVKSDNSNYIEKFINNSAPVNAILKFNKSFSSYKVIKTLDSDNSKGFKPVKIVAGNNKEYYRDLQLNRNAFISDALGTEYLVIYPDVEYEITSETKLIQGYTCYKAIRKDKSKPNYIAWFTLELPFSFGPKEVHSLIGLVLQYDDGVAFTFVAKEIKLKGKNSKIESMPNIKEMSFEEYQKLMRKICLNFSLCG